MQDWIEVEEDNWVNLNNVNAVFLTQDRRGISILWISFKDRDSHYIQFKTEKEARKFLNKVVRGVE